MAVRFRSNESAIAMAGFAVFLVLVRIVSMIWALVRLYDFRLTRVGEDLRSEYGLFTKVAATVPIRRVQAITINAGPLHRWLERATVRVATAGGAGKKDQRPRASANGSRRSSTRRRCRICCNRSCRDSTCRPSTGSRCTPAPSRVP